MLRLIIQRVNGYLCLSEPEVRLARQHLDPVAKPPAEPEKTPPASTAALDLRA